MYIMSIDESYHWIIDISFLRKNGILSSKFNFFYSLMFLFMILFLCLLFDQVSL